ncbi:MAG: hypothetical protein OEZ02_12070 [Anaerolineae bacterium]|nr:hypothetical protein [Anaerolineae bacterium]
MARGRYQIDAKQRPWKIHPVWRGIGCLMFIIIPIFSIAVADVLIENNTGWIRIPKEMRGSFTIPGIDLYVRYFWAKLALGGIVTFALFAVLTVVYSIMYSISGARTRGPMDAPPVRRKVKKRNR